MERTASYNEPHEEESEPIDLRQILTIFLERKWLIAACIAVTVAAGTAYVMLAPPVYRASTLLEVPEGEGEGFGERDLRSEEALKTIEENLKRLSLFRRVVELDEIRGDAAFQNSFDQPVDSISSLKLAEDIREDWARIETVGGTRLITVSIEHTDPPLAQKFANTIVNEYLREWSEKKPSLETLIAEAGRLQKHLRGLQTAHQKVGETIAMGERIDEKERELAVETQSKGENHPMVVQIRNLIAGLNADLEVRLKQLKPLLAEEGAAAGDGATPAPETPEGTLAPKEELERIKPYQENLDVEITITQAHYEKVRKDIEDLNQVDDPIIVSEEAILPMEPVKPMKIQILAASVVLGGGLGVFLAWLLHALHRSLRTVDEAERILGLPVLAAIHEDSRLPDTKWLGKTRNRILRELKENHAQTLETNAAKSRIPKKGKKGKIEPLVLLSDPGSPIAEAFRTLRAALTLNNKGGDQHVYLVTSAIPGEGKSFVAANLAFAISAQEEHRTLLIDADLRRPTMNSLFDIRETGGGIVEAVLSGEDWKKHIVQSGISKLDLLPAGISSPNPAELLAGPGMRKLIGELRQHYDRIVIDSAPVNAVADSLLVAPIVDSAILVARAGVTPREAVARARNLLDDAGRKPIGFVLNGLPKKAGLTGNPYYYYYDVSADGYGKNYG